MGSLAYAIAKADGIIQEEEILILKKLAQKELELTDVDNEWIEHMFSRLEKDGITLDDAYNYAIDTLEANRSEYDFDEGMKRRCLNFMEKVAEAFDNTSNLERNVIDKFKEDIKKF